MEKQFKPLGDGELAQDYIDLISRQVAEIEKLSFRYSMTKSMFATAALYFGQKRMTECYGSEKASEILYMMADDTATKCISELRAISPLFEAKLLVKQKPTGFSQNFRCAVLAVGCVVGWGLLAFSHIGL